MEPRTTRQIIAEGGSHRELRRQLDAGTIHRIARGAYVERLPTDPREAHRLLITATVPGLPAGVLSHASAAVLHGLPVPDGALTRLHITRPRASKGGGWSGVRVHVHAAKLPDEDVQEVDGFAVTGVVRTCLDLARILPFEDAVVLLDAAMHDPDHPADERTDIRLALESGLAGLGRVPGVRRARQALAFADGRAASPLESRSRIIMWQQGLPKPELQYEVYDSFGHLVARYDFAWPEQRVYGECDGKVKYAQLLRPGESAADVVMREKRRDNDAAARGWRDVHWDDGDLKRPRVLANRIRAVLFPRAKAA